MESQSCLLHVCKNTNGHLVEQKEKRIHIERRKAVLFYEIQIYGKSVCNKQMLVGNKTSRNLLGRYRAV